MMQSLPLSHSIYSRISKDCIQSFTKLNYPSFSVYSGLKSTISTVPRNKLSLKDRLKRAGKRTDRLFYIHFEQAFSSISGFTFVRGLAYGGEA